jgi:hypothetical protein
MATVRRHGNVAAFWNAATVNATDKSNYANTGRMVDQIIIFIKTNGAATFQLQVAASTGDTVEGVAVDIDEATLAPAGAAQWYDYSYLNNATASNGALGLFALSGAAAVAIGMPDWVGGYIRLLCTVGTGVTVTAGFEGQGA